MLDISLIQKAVEHYTGYKLHSVYALTTVNDNLEDYLEDLLLGYKDAKKVFEEVFANSLQDLISDEASSFIEYDVEEELTIKPTIENEDYWEVVKYLSNRFTFKQFLEAFNENSMVIFCINDVYKVVER